MCASFIKFAPDFIIKLCIVKEQFCIAHKITFVLQIGFKEISTFDF